MFRNTKVEIEKPADSLLTRLYTKESINYIRQQKKGINHFFLYLSGAQYAAFTSVLCCTVFFLEKKKGGALGAVITEMDEGLAAIWKAWKKKVWQIIRFCVFQ